MDDGYFEFIVIAILVFIAVQVKTDKDCRSHDSFAFTCHHNDSNTDVYLRRIIKKLDKLVEQIDKTPTGERATEQFIVDFFEADLKITFLLNLLRLVRTGKIESDGGIFKPIKDYFRNSETKAFDFYEDYLICALTERNDYTKEEAEQLRKSLPNRNQPSATIKDVILLEIKLDLDKIILDQLKDDIIEENRNDVIPTNLNGLVYERYKQLDANSKKKTIMAEIAEGKILDTSSISKRFKELCSSSSGAAKKWKVTALGAEVSKQPAITREIESK